MRKAIFALLAGMALLVSSCYDDSEVWETLRDHEARIAKLEALCSQYNTTISSLQTIVAALQENSSIKTVAPIMENGKTIGYTITFTRGNSITIYNGTDGQDGLDGHTPIVGVKQDADGLWYWTLDDAWMLNAEGNKVPAAGTTPSLKIENDYWWVSYDGGVNWAKLGKAVGESGDPMFSSVEWDDKSVTFVLYNGQTITIPIHNLTWVYV